MKRLELMIMRLICWMLLLMPMSILAGEEPSRVARVIVAAGDVTAHQSETADDRELERRSPIFEGERVRTGPESTVQLRFTDDAVMALDADTQIEIDTYRHDDPDKPNRAVMRLVEGGLRTLTGSLPQSDPDTYELQTPVAGIGIRGTDYQAVVSDEQLAVGAWSGRIRVYNEAGEIDLGGDVDFRFAEVRGPEQLPEGRLDVPAELSTDISISQRSSDSSTADSDSGTNDEVTQQDSELDSATEERLSEQIEEAVAEEEDDFSREEDSESEPESEPDTWIPDLNQTSLVIKTADSELGTPDVPEIVAGIQQFQSNSFDPETEQYVARVSEDVLVSMEGATPENTLVQTNYQGFPINYGVWNDASEEQDERLRLHDGEGDEQGTMVEADNASLVILSVDAVFEDGLADILTERGGGEIVSFGANLAFPTVSASGTGIDRENSSFSFDLNLSSAAISNGEVRLVTNDEALWSFDFDGQVLSDDVQVDINEDTFSSSDGSAGSADLALALAEHGEVELLGSVAAFDLVSDGGAFAQGILFVEEAN